MTTSPLQVGSPCAGGVLNNSESEPIVVTPQSNDNLTENSTLVPDHNHTNAMTPHHATNGHNDVRKSVSVDDSQSVGEDEQVEIGWASFSDSQCDVNPFFKMCLLLKFKLKCLFVCCVSDSRLGSVFT